MKLNELASFPTNFEGGCTLIDRPIRPVTGVLYFPIDIESTILTLLTGLREKIVRGLIEASELEHILMLQYIYAAVSLKSHPSGTISYLIHLYPYLLLNNLEFEDGPRKHHQFETVRFWKREIMRYFLIINIMQLITTV